MKRYILLAILGIALFSCRPMGDDLLGYGMNDSQAFDPTKESFAEQFKAFWLAMNENYCIWDFEEKYGLDWDEVYDTYLPLFEALDDSTRQPVTDDELQALYQSFLDSIHDGHCSFDIKNRHTGNYINIFPNVNRVFRERGDLLLAEALNITTLDLYRSANAPAGYRILQYDVTGSSRIIVELLDSAAQQMLAATTAYITAVDAAGGPNDFNDSIYEAVKDLQTQSILFLSFVNNPSEQYLEEMAASMAQQYNILCTEYDIVAKQIDLVMTPIDPKIVGDGLMLLQSAIFDGNIAYLRISNFALTPLLKEEATSTDTTSAYYAYQMAARRVWHLWFDAIQSLHASGQLAGVILDLRNNGGGFVSDYRYAVGALLPSGGYQSHMLRVKNGSGRLDFAPVTPFIVGTYPDEHAVITEEPIVVISNSNSISMAENSTWGVTTLPNGYFIGTRTFGALSALADDPAYYSGCYSGCFGVKEETTFYGFVPRYVCLFGDDQHIAEGVGFEPDEEVVLDVDNWNTEMRDNQLERAIDYILKR